MKTYYIYKLYFHEEPNVAYIGQTDNLKRRLQNHNYESQDSGTVKRNWIMNRKGRGWELQMEVIDSTTDLMMVNFMEIMWIKTYKEKLGYILKNGTVGGDGIKNPPEEVRKKISNKLKGVPKSEEARRNMSNAAKGRLTSPATRAKLSEARRGAKHPNAKFTYELTKDGVSFTTHCLSEFCREHEISAPNICKVINGAITNHKGWTATKLIY